MTVRCYLFRYGDGSEQLRWFAPPNEHGWMQQLLKVSLEDGRLVHTGSDPSAVVYEPGIAPLVEAGKAVEL